MPHSYTPEPFWAILIAFQRTIPDVNTISPVLDVMVRTGLHATRISIGVGFDASVARAIIRSIRHA